MSLIAVFPYGSLVYGTANHQSDVDLIVVSSSITMDTRRQAIEKAIVVYGKRQFDVHEYTDMSWKTALTNGEIAFVEAACSGPLWGPPCVPPKLKPSQWLDVGYKRFARDKMLSDKRGGMAGLKSLWHSYRIALFLGQLISTGRIFDWACANEKYAALSQTTPSELITLIEAEYTKLEKETK